MYQTVALLTFDTDGQGLFEITHDINSWLRQTEIHTGLVTLFCRHTSCSLLINENAAPAVQRDLLRWLSAAAPEGDGYEHNTEGPDDMPAHIRTMLTGNSLAIPLSDGVMMLGRWQGVYIAEHRRAPHKRQIAAHVFGN